MTRRRFYPQAPHGKTIARLGQSEAQGMRAGAPIDWVASQPEWGKPPVLFWKR